MMDNLISLATNAMDKKNYSSALETWKQIISLTKKPNKNYFYNQLYCLYKLEKFEEANLLEEVIKDLFATYRNLGHLLQTAKFFGNRNVEILKDIEGAYRIIDCDTQMSSEILFFTFGKVSTRHDHIPFGYPFLIQQGYKHIHIAQYKRTQYQNLSAESFAESVENIVKKYKYIFTYGSSLGGYAALYYAGAINACAIAANPRLPLHPINLKFKGTLWREGGHYDEYDYLHEYDFKSSTKSPIVLIDPKDEMDAHFFHNYLSNRLPNCELINVENSRHSSLLVLKKQGKLKSFIVNTVNKELKNNQFNISDFLSDRIINNYNFIYIQDKTFTKYQNNEHKQISLDENAIKQIIEGNGTFRLKEESIEGEYKGPLASYQLKIKLVENNFLSNGFSLRFKITGWDNIRYLALGHTEDEVFRHIKIAHPSVNQWTSFSISYNDIAFGLKNDWLKYSSTIFKDLRIYISGKPSEHGARIELSVAGVWLEEESLLHDWENVKDNSDVFKSIEQYFIKCNPNIDVHARKFLDHGIFPLSGEAQLEWDAISSLPNNFFGSGTYRYIWHSMQFAISLMIYSSKHSDFSALISAREFITLWMEKSFFSIDSDTKYTWYDHGTAERLLAFVFMHSLGIQHNFDDRFMTKLRFVIQKHAQLLASDVFYALHQSSRYHNHAWFQDIALIAVGVAFPELKASKKWLKISLTRLSEQFDELIVRDNGFAVFVENSIGYHQGIQRLVDFAGELIALSGEKSTIPEISNELHKWTTFLKYPDNRVPSHGDTFKKPNPALNCDNFIPYEEKQFTFLKNAGYSVLKSNHFDKPFMLCFFATNLSKTHKHEDNLSMTLFYDGIEWLIDPSMYSHDYKEIVPSYLRSALAHNNLVIINKEYSLDTGLVELTAKHDKNTTLISGAHKSYSNVLVERHILAMNNELNIQVTDSFMTSEKNLQSFIVFHFGEGVNAEISDEGVFLTHAASKSKLFLKIDGEIIKKMGWNDPKLPSCAGEGFEVYHDTISLYCKVNANQKFIWKLNVLPDKFEHEELISKENTEQILDSNSAIFTLDILWKKYLDLKNKESYNELLQVIKNTNLIREIEQSKYFNRVYSEFLNEFIDFHNSSNIKINKLQQFVKNKSKTEKYIAILIMLNLLGLKEIFIENSEMLIDFEKKSNLKSHKLINLLTLDPLSKYHVLDRLDSNDFFDSNGNIQSFGTFYKDANFILCQFQNIKFFIISLISPIDGFFFPSYGVILRSNSSKFSMIDRVQKVMVNSITNLEEYINIWNFQVDNNLCVLCRDKRPAHVFYDELSGAFYLRQQIQKDIRIGFAPAASFFEKINESEFNLFDNILNYSKMTTFGFHKRMNNISWSDDYRTWLISKSLELYQKEISLFKQKNQLIWIGITAGEKRSWIEEKASILAFIKWSRSRFKNCLFVVDGYTGNGVHSENAQIIINEHIKVLNSIILESELDTNCFYSIIGKQLFEKIAFASNCSFFLTIMGTPSNWISKVARVPGVLHHTQYNIEQTDDGSSRFKLRENIFADNTLAVEFEDIKDIYEKSPSSHKEEANPNYSIKAETIIDLCEKCFERYCTK